MGTFEGSYDAFSSNHSDTSIHLEKLELDEKFSLFQQVVNGLASPDGTPSKPLNENGTPQSFPENLKTNEKAASPTGVAQLSSPPQPKKKKIELPPLQRHIETIERFKRKGKNKMPITDGESP